MDDNMRHPKKQVEAQNELVILLNTVLYTKEKFKTKEIIKTLLGKTNAIISSHKINELTIFGEGNYKDKFYWMALIRQSLVAGYLVKEIETYGVIRLTEKAKNFLKKSESFKMTEDHKYDEFEFSAIGQIKSRGFDNVLMRLLIELRKQVAKSVEIPPYAVFQEYSLEDMCLKYPINKEELVNINGVGEGKAKRYGEKFLELIQKYIEENQITRSDDLVVKSTGINSSLKLYLIQSIDRKLSFEDIAAAKGMDIEKLISEIETIVFSGTKLDINYYLEDLFDDDQLEELYNYYIESESDSIDKALDEFEGDYEEEELRLYRIKFMSEIAN
jgi:ATP-dependent DNA helicase RecQ